VAAAGEIEKLGEKVIKKGLTRSFEGNGSSTILDKAFARAAKIEGRAAKEEFKAAKEETTAAKAEAPKEAAPAAPKPEEKPSKLKWLTAGAMGAAAGAGRAKHIAINLGQKNVAS